MSATCETCGAYLSPIPCAKCGEPRECPSCAESPSYAQGRADERAAVVAWLLTDAPGLADTRAHIAALIRTGCHEVKKP